MENKHAWIERRLLEAAQPSGQDIFMLYVRTGNVRGAGTDAAVRVELIGSNARSGPIELKYSDQLDLFFPLISRSMPTAKRRGAAPIRRYKQMRFVETFPMLPLEVS